MRRILIYGLSALISSGLGFLILYSVCELISAIFIVHPSKFNVTKIL